MAHIKISTIENRLAMMKRADNSWSAAYVLDVGHLLNERSALHANAGKLRAALDEAAKQIDFLVNWMENSYGGINADTKLGRSYAAAARAVLADTVVETADAKESK